MRLSIGIARKLLRLVNGERIPSSQLTYPVIQRMVDDSIITVQVQGRSRKILFITKPEKLDNYLENHFGISNLSKYIEILESKTLTRSEAVKNASDSKVKTIRTFEGFLINCYQPIQVAMYGQNIDLIPQPGTYTFVYEYKEFVPPKGVTIVGVENPENFRYIEKQHHLFSDITPLFVSRYPQSKDLITWLKMIPNNYIHFGDFDFSGINIYHYECKCYLKERATFFIPDNIEKLIANYGNRSLYDRQLIRKTKDMEEASIKKLISYFHTYKKCLEQEILIALS